MKAITPYIEIRDQIAIKTNQSKFLMQSASQVGLAVSITTVAVVLSNAMANRIEQKQFLKYLNQIQQILKIVFVQCD